MPVGANAGVAGMMVNVGVNLQSFNAGMDQVEQRGAKAAQSLNSIGSALTTGAGIGAGFAAANAALSAMSGMAQAAGSAVIGLNSDLEQARIGFTAFTGSAEKANAFVQQLQQFAAKTTFEFPGLLQAARQLTGMGVQAELVIPILKDVSTAVMRVGGGDTAITAVNRALKQMMATGKVMAGDMNQLAQAGLPAWKMLADSMGMTIGQVRKLSEEGKISADQMLAAFHKFATENGMDQLLEKSSQTWQAATSNIIDGLRNIGAEGFEPLFNVMRDFAVQLANLLTSQDAANFAQDLKATVTDLVQSMQPLGESINRAFEAFKSGGLSAAIASLLTDVKNFATEMGGAGVQLITEFAGGIMEGASSLITEAANFVAEIIASYLIGNSPPPVGPLSNIAQGGTAVIQAYVEGLKAGTSGVADVAQGIVDAFGNVDKTLTLAAAREAFQAAGEDVKALQSNLTDVEGALRSIDALVRENQSTLHDYQNAATDIKDAYDAAIDPLQRQVDALKEVNDLTKQTADLQDRITLARLKGALQTAQGDPVVRAQLQTRLDALQEQEKELSLQERSLSLQNQQASIAARARGEKVKDTQGSVAANALAQRRLQIQLQENQIQQQLNGMVDKEAVARIKSQQAQVQAVKDQRDINSEVEQLNRALQAAPLEAQIKDLKEQQRALLEPIQERIKETQREGQALQEQRKNWQDIKAAITDVMQTQRQEAAAAKKEAQEASKAAKEAALTRGSNLAGIFTPEEIKAQATKVGESWLTGIRESISANGAKIIGGAVGAVLGAVTFGPLGAVAGAAFGAQFSAKMQELFGSQERLFGAIAGKISDALNIDTGKASNAAEAFAIIWETVKERIHLAIEQAIIDIARILDIDVSGGATQADRLAIIWETTGTRISTAVTNTQTALQPIIDGIGAQWQTMIDTMNSAEFKDNISIIASNINEIVKLLAGSFGKLGEQINAVNTNPIDGTQFVTLGSVLQATIGFVARLTTALVNLIDLIATTSHTLVLFGQNVASAFQGAADIIQAGIAFAAGDFDAAEAIFGDKRKMDQDIAARGQEIQKSWSEMWQRIQQRKTDAENVGKSAGEGLAAGITASAPTVEEASSNLASQSVTSTFAATMQSKSPSVVMVEQGTFVTEGLTQGITAGTPVVVAAVTEQAAAMLVAYTEGWTAIHTGTDQQLSEIHALIESKLAEIVALVPPAMQSMQAAFATGFSAIHTQTGTQLGEIHTLIMSQSEQWRAAGLALGTALGEGIAAAQLNVQRSMMSLMSAGGATGSKASPELESTINKMAAKYGLDPRLFMAQMQHESAGFDPNVISGKRKGGSGELGIGQFMPATLTTMLQRNGLQLEQYLGNAQVQVELAAQHMSELVKVFGDYDKALQAYNGGAGGVGSAATQRYAQIVHDVADSLRTQNTGGAGTQLMSAGAAARGMSLNVDQITAGRNAGLSMAEAQAICGPYAAVLFAQATGKNPSLSEAKELAAAVGWTASAGMGGTGNFMSLLGRMGIQAVRQAATPENVNAALAAGNPIALSTPRHYFVGSGGTAQGGINVGATGSVMSRYGGTANMTLDQITAVGGGMNDLIVLTQKLETQGQKTFNSLTTVTGQFGDVLSTGNEAVQAGLEGTEATASAATAQMAAQTQTLTAHIQQGLVPAGLAARDAVGQMAIGIQPLIAAWANGQVTGDQLAQSIVQLASDTGLATQPLAQYAAGNASVGEALRQVMTQLAQTDPAFAAIEQSMSGAQVSTEQLADTLLSGLANVTGNVRTSLSQMAPAVEPLKAAFASGAISSEQFVASVVELAATSGLTQAPLRMMQDGVITADQALAQVVTTAGQATPSLLGMSTAFGELPAPAAEAATSFLDWIKSLQETTTATEAVTENVALIPESVAEIEQPMQESATAAMETLPTATNDALQRTVDAIRGITGDAQSAAQEVGTAIVEGIRSTVEAGAEEIANAAKEIVEKALEAAKKAAEEVKKSVKKDGGDDKGDEKAKGGRLTPGVWTLVGEQGPELISPSGHVYTAGQTSDMLLKGINSGLFTLNKFATGGDLYGANVVADKRPKKEEKSKNKETTTPTPTPTETTPKRHEEPKTAAELDLEEAILKVEQQRNIVLAAIAPINEQIAAYEQLQKDALAGSLEDQMKIAYNKKQSLEIDQAILKIQFQGSAMYSSMHSIQTKLSELQFQQQQAAKGSLGDRAELLRLDMSRLKNEAELARLNAAALPVRQAQAYLQKQYDISLKGTVASQQLVARAQKAQHENQQQTLLVQMQQAPLQAEAADLQLQINKTLAGTAEQRAIITENTEKQAALDVQILANQAALLPIQTQIRKIQSDIDDITRGSLADQYQSIDLERESAKLRLQEIDAESQLRKVNEGTLNLSQEQVNALHKQLEAVQAQQASLEDQSEIKSLNATIATTDARKQLTALQQQERTHQTIEADLNDQKSVIDNQTQSIAAQNTLAVAGQQAKLEELNLQIGVYQAQIDKLNAQNAVLDLQVQNIQLGNQIRADALAEQLISLNDQVSKYDDIIGKVQEENDKITAQSAIITANNAVAAAAYNGQISQLQDMLDHRQREIDKLNEQKDLITGQTGLITTQNQIRAAGYDAALIQLNSQKSVQDELVVMLNAQLGTLNAQKKVYEDIRDLANQIANRPVTTPPGGNTGGTGGPPGTVVATATKSGAQTLYLSRGTGTDGWYTSDGRLMVQGGSANPPSGYNVRWLAEGGTWHRGEVAVVGEEGPELAIAAQDMHVFPHERSASIARAFLDRSEANNSKNSERNVTVNVEYHRHGGTDYGEGTLPQIIREAINVALRS